MKVTIDLENLETLVYTAINKNIEEIIKIEIDTMIRKTIEKDSKKKIEDIVNTNFERFVNEYITTTTIKTGGDFWNDEEAKEYTLEQFIKAQLKQKLESNTLKVKKKGRTSSYSDDFENVSYEEYIKRTCNINDLIKKEFENKLNKFMDEIRKDINETMKNTFDNSTRTMLSNVVLNILSANDTYKQIENNIKCIADRKE